MFLVLLCVLASAAAGQHTIRPGRLELDALEEATEEMANDLLDLSVATRERDAPRIGAFFGDPLTATALPAIPSPLRPRIKWIGEHGWSASEGTRSRVGRAEFLRSFETFLAHFSEIEDARFKVQGSAVDPGGLAGRGHLKFFLVGRDTDGRREWVRGAATASLSRVEGHWQIREFILEKLESLVARVDLFSEVAVPAGVTATDPPFLARADVGLISHGAAAADADGDGLLDVFATGTKENFLYLNTGDGRFRDVAAEAGLKKTPAIGIAPLFLDYDNDGDPDIFLSAVGKQMLFQNRHKPDGRLVFKDVSGRAGVAVPAYGFSAIAGDVNRDGWPDIYVASYNRFGTILPDSWDGATNGTPNLLFVNQRNGRFIESADSWGVDDSRWSYAAAFADVDDDGDQDLYVANDFGGGNPLFMNEGDRFVDAAAERGAADRGYGMGVSFGDYDNDGDLDLHVTKMSSTAGNRILGRLFPGAPADESLLKKLAAGNSLYENLGGGRFREATAGAGPFPAGWAWGGGFLDFDNDGWEDLYTPNGFLSGRTMKDT
jgi:hypothetical protein